VADRTAASAERAISFGPFHLIPAQRLLLEGDLPVRLGSRALDILIALVERPGEVLGKDELMARVWPNTVVEEGNLKFQVGALRRTLGGGNRYLVNVPGRGYSFAAPVTRTEETRPAAPQATTTESTHNLPALLTRLVGRADAVSRIVAQVPRQRLLTIVGPGGIGKTSVALAAAEASINNYEHGVRPIDLAPIGDPRLVPSALAAALGLDIYSDDPLPGLIAATGQAIAARPRQLRPRHRGSRHFSDQHTEGYIGRAHPGHQPRGVAGRRRARAPAAAA
jgi:DNA-binding winged helix-turn-helix (wHTH) protein